MSRQSNSPTYNKNHDSNNNRNTNNRRDNYNRSNNYRRNPRNNQDKSIRTGGRTDTNAPEAGGWDTVSRTGAQRHQTYQKRQWRPRQSTNHRFNSLKSSPTPSSRSYTNTNTNSFSALDDTEPEPPRNGWCAQKSDSHSHSHSRQRFPQTQQRPPQQPQQPQQPQPMMEFPPLSANITTCKPASTPIQSTSKPAIQGVWGKKLSEAVVTEEKFEKQVIKPKVDDGMIAINSTNGIHVQKSSYHKFNYKNKYNPMLFKNNQSWADMADEEESQYYQDSYSDDDEEHDYCDNNASVSDEDEYYSDDYDYR